MTFSVKSERDGIEYSAHNLNSIFAQRKNLLAPSFYRMIWDIFRFRREFGRLLEIERREEGLVPFLRSQGLLPQIHRLFHHPAGIVAVVHRPEAHR